MRSSRNNAIFHYVFILQVADHSVAWHTLQLPPTLHKSNRVSSFKRKKITGAKLKYKTACTSTQHRKMDQSGPVFTVRRPKHDCWEGYFGTVLPPSPPSTTRRNQRILGLSIHANQYTTVGRPRDRKSANYRYLLKPIGLVRKTEWVKPRQIFLRSDLQICVKIYSKAILWLTKIHCYQRLHSSWLCTLLH